MSDNNNELNIEIRAELDIEKSIAKINADLEKIEEQIKELEVNVSLNKGDSLKKINNQIEELNKQKQDLTAELKLNQDALKKQYKEIQNNNEISLDIETDKASKQLSGISGNISSVNAETMGLAHSFKSAFANMGLALSTESILRTIKQLEEEATEAVKLYDKMSTNLKIITGKSDVSVLIGSYAEKALDMKVDISEYEKASEVILRAGKNLEESNQYTETAIKLSKTGFINADDSAENLLVIANAYDLTADKLESVTDALLTLDTSTNTEAGALSEAMSKSAKNAQLAGLSYEKLGAIIAKLKDSTGKSESELSTSLNQIFNRTYRVKPNAYTFENEAGEIENLSKPLSDVEKIMNQLGISIRESSTRFKSFEDIISTIAPIWKDLDSVDQNAISSVFAGQHKNVFLNLVNDWDEINALTKEAENSSGATASKYNSYLESIESKSAALSTATKELWNNLVPDNTVANLTDATTSLIQFVDEYEVLQNIAKTGLVYGLAKGFISAKSGFAGMVKDVKNVSTAFSQLEAVQKSSFGTNEYDASIQNLGDTISNLSDKQAKLVLSTKSLSKKQRLAIIEASGVEKAEAKAKLETLGLAKAQETAANSTFSLKGSMKSLWAVMKANPIGVLTVAFGLISTGISIYKQKQEEAIQSAKQSAQETSDYIDSLSGLKDKYLEIVDSENSVSEKTKELNQFKQELIETYGFEKDVIDELNLSREHGVELLDKEAQNNARSKRNEFYAQNDKAIDKAIEKVETNQGIEVKTSIVRTNEISDDIKNIFSNISYKDALGGNEWSFKIDANNVFDEYEKINSIIADLQNRSLNSSETNLYKALVSKSKELKEIIDDYGKTYNTYYDYKAQDLFYDYIDKFGDASQLSGKKLKDWKQSLIETADGNTVLEESLTNLIDKIYQFDNAENKVTSISGLDVNTDDISKSLEEYSNQISDFISEKEKIDAALKEQEENGGISIKTAFDLSTSGYQSAIQFDRETNSYKLLRKEIDKVAKSRRAELKVKLESEKSRLTKNNSDELENWRKNTGRTKDDVLYQAKLKEYNASVQDITSSYDLYISMLEKADFATSNFSDTVSKTNQDIEKYSENISKISNSKSTVKSAQEEQEKFGRLSIDTIKSLHEAGLSGAMSYNEMTGETYLLVDAIDELTRAQIENQKVDINKSITETTNKIAEASERLRNIGNPSDAYTANMVSGLNQNIAQWQSQLDELGIQKMELGSLLFSFETDDESTKQSAEEAAEKALEEYINSIKEAFDKEKSDLDHLLNMDVISQEEYYNRLFGLNEKYFKGKTELLDEYRQYEEEVYKGLKQKQIDAIQEQIDALKSVNEEKQEEIDLEKAKQALENAKRNKTISVYDSERGWINETDRKAIDTAQKEYDDLVLNEKIEALENMIDAIENGTNTSHSLDESVDVIQQVGNIMNGSQEDFINNIKSTLINHGENPIDYINQLNSLPIDNVVSDQMLRSIQTMQENIYTTNNKRMTVNIDKVVADDPMRFAEQMEQIANKSFDTKFMPAMNDLAEDIKRHRANHSSY